MGVTNEGHEKKKHTLPSVNVSSIHQFDVSGLWLITLA